MTHVAKNPGTRVPVGDRRRPAYFDVLLAEAARRWRISPEDITRADAKEKQFSRARQAVMWVLRDQGLALPHIGYLLNRHHTTVMFGLRAVEQSRPRLMGAMALKLAVAQLGEPIREKVSA